MMYKDKPKIVRGGAEKLRLKREAERKAAGSDPKQTKLPNYLLLKSPKKVSLFSKLLLKL